VAGYDLLRHVFTRVIDRTRLESWSEEAVDTYLPPAQMVTPNDAAEITAPLCHLPMRALAQGNQGVFVWILMDGSILTMEGAVRSLVVWRPGDPELDEVLELAGIGASQRILLTSPIR